MNHARYGVVVLALFVPLFLTACPNKDKDKDTPPTPVTQAPPAPTPSVALAPEVPDAGADADAADADADAPHVVGVSNLTKCCNAIAQNQKSAPPDQQLLYAAALAACRSGVIPPQYRNLPQCSK